MKEIRLNPRASQSQTEGPLSVSWNGVKSRFSRDEKKNEKLKCHLAVRPSRLPREVSPISKLLITRQTNPKRRVRRWKTKLARSPAFFGWDLWKFVSIEFWLVCNKSTARRVGLGSIIRTRSPLLKVLFNPFYCLYLKWRISSKYLKFKIEIDDLKFLFFKFSRCTF